MNRRNDNETNKLISRYKTMLLLSCVIFISSGCSSSYQKTKYPITYDSNPRGASLICNNNNFGYTPTTLYYDFDDKTKESGTATTTLCQAKWISGVEKNYLQVWDLKKFPNGVQQTLQRPDGDGYEKDAQFALQAQMYQAQRDQADFAAMQNMNQFMQNMNYNSQMQQQNFQLQQLNNNLMYKRYGY